VTSFEDVWRDRADLADKVEQIEAEMVRYRELEQLLRTTLISAERASQQMTDQARREMDIVLGEARTEAREIVRSAMSERELLMAEVNRIRAQMGAALKTLGDEEQARDEATQVVAQAVAQAPPRPATPSAPVQQPVQQAPPAPAPPRPSQPLRPPGQVPPGAPPQNPRASAGSPAVWPPVAVQVPQRPGSASNGPSTPAPELIPIAAYDGDGGPPTS